MSCLKTGADLSPCAVAEQVPHVTVVAGKLSEAVTVGKVARIVGNFVVAGNEGEYIRDFSRPELEARLCLLTVSC